MRTRDHHELLKNMSLVRIKDLVSDDRVIYDNQQFVVKRNDNSILLVHMFDRNPNRGIRFGLKCQWKVEKVC